MEYDNKFLSPRPSLPVVSIVKNEICFLVADMGPAISLVPPPKADRSESTIRSNQPDVLREEWVLASSLLVSPSNALIA